MSEVKGVKLDAGKSRLDLVSAPWIVGLGDVLAYGAVTRGAHNWREGIPLSRLLAAAQRHIWGVIGGQDFDGDSGFPHLLNASCELMFAYETWLLRKDMDDRYVLPLAPTPKAGPAIEADADCLAKIRKDYDAVKQSIQASSLVHQIPYLLGIIEKGMKR